MTGIVLRRHGPDLVLATMWAAFGMGIYWLTRGDDALLGWMHLLLAVGWLARIVMPDGRRATSVVTVAIIAVALVLLAFAMYGLLQRR